MLLALMAFELVICGRLILLKAVYFVDKLLHVLKAAPFLAFAIVLDRVKEHGHELHLVNLAQDLRLDDVTAPLALIVVVFLLLEDPLERALVIGDAATRLNAAGQGLGLHEVSGARYAASHARLVMMAMVADKVRHLLALLRVVVVYIALFTANYLCRTPIADDLVLQINGGQMDEHLLRN